MVILFILKNNSIQVNNQITMFKPQSTAMFSIITKENR